jgi:hypothetical protein
MPKVLRYLIELLKMPYNIYLLRKEIEELRLKVDKVISRQKDLSAKSDDGRILLGKHIADCNKNRQAEILHSLQLSEFRVFSQWGDDGIIQFLVDYLDIVQKVFVEFGVESYSEANTRFLLINNNWTGLVMDSSLKHGRHLQTEDIYWKYNITFLPAFITKENINELISSQAIRGDIGLLHIDVDGNDYWIWKELTVISPVIVIIEYNSVFGSSHPWTIPYQKGFNRTDSHYSNLYFGASLLALCDLAEEKGYSFIGCNSNGNNAYFVRNDKMKELKPLTAHDGYVLSMFREGRDKDHQLTYLSGNDRLLQIKDRDVFNTRTQRLEKI